MDFEIAGKGKPDGGRLNQRPPRPGSRKGIVGQTTHLCINMAYNIASDRVTWKTKKLKVCLESFRLIDERLALDRNQVLYLGKKAKLEPKTFRKLDEIFLVDADSVFFQMPSKLKAVKADSSTFESLGGGYGRDSKSFFWQDKALKGVDRASFRLLQSDFAADQRGLFFRKKRIVKCEGLQDFQVWGDGDLKWMRVNEDAYILEYDSPYPMESVPDWSTFCHQVGDYAQDKNHLYYRHRQTSAAASPNFRAIDEYKNVVTDGEICLERGRVLPDADPETLSLEDTFLVDSQGVYGEDGNKTPYQADLPLPNLNKLFERLLCRQFALLDAYHPLGHYHQAEEIAKREKRYHFEVVAEAKADHLSLVIDGTQHRSKLIEFVNFASRLWAESRFGEPFLRFLHQTGSYSNGDFQLAEHIQCGGEQLAIVYAQLFPGEAPAYARQLMKSVSYRVRLPYLTKLSYDALRNSAPRSRDSYVTTNLARARELVKKEEHLQLDTGSRREVACELYGLAAASSQCKYFLNEIAGAILMAYSQENNPEIRDKWLAAIGQIVSHAFVKSEVSAENYYEQLKPLVQFLVDEKFNLDLNLARLCECELYQSGQMPSRQKLQALVGDRRMSPMWSGLHLDFPRVEFWLLASRLRVAYHKGKEWAEEALRLVLEELGSLRRECCEPDIFASLLNDAESLAHAWGLEFENFSRPKTATYTSLGYQEHIINEADYRIDGLWVNPDQQREFVVEGWPWARKLKLELSIGDWKGSVKLHLGLRAELPKKAPTPTDAKPLRLVR